MEENANLTERVKLLQEEIDLQRNSTILSN